MPHACDSGDFGDASQLAHDACEVQAVHHLHGEVHRGVLAAVVRIDRHVLNIGFGFRDRCGNLCQHTALIGHQHLDRDFMRAVVFVVPGDCEHALGIVLWELLVGHRLHNRAQGEAELIAEIIAGKLPTLTEELAPDRSFIGPYRWREIETIESTARPGRS